CDQRVAVIFDQIEKDGATAIEDRLQDEVPKYIVTLKHAGIKIWVLTEDKMKTAISIDFSTCLLARNINLIIIRGDTYGETATISPNPYIPRSPGISYDPQEQPSSTPITPRTPLPQQYLSSPISPKHLLYITRSHILSQKF
ncbi:11911_t:CDS:2, partial [Acaulospora morrowiae]